MLRWISNNKKPVKQWVLNRVVETLRFTEPSKWMFVSSQHMMADPGTRRVDDRNLVNKDSTWISGYDWIKKDQKDFPTKPVHQIRLKNKIYKHYKKKIF